MRLAFTTLTNGPELARERENITLVFALAKERLRTYSEIRADGGVLTDEQSVDEKALREMLTDLIRPDLLRAIAADKLELHILAGRAYEHTRAVAQMRLTKAEQALADLDAEVSD